MRHRLFGSDDEYNNYYSYLSQRSTRAPSHDHVDDGASRRHTGTRGTGKDTTSNHDDMKPWRLTKQLINSLSQATRQHHRIPLFDASEIHCLRSSANNFRAKEDFYLDAFFEIRWYNDKQKRDKASSLAAWNAFIPNVQNSGRERWL